MHSRRRFIQSLAATLALPNLPSLHAAVTKAPSTSPLRMAYIYAPNGVNLNHWLPTDGGHVSRTLAPLASMRDHFSMIRGLDHQNAQANGDGPGDHARANATFLTGAQARKTADSNIRVGISVDQIAARNVGHMTRLPSLELSTDPPRRSGHCDSGYSCAYQFNLSWRGESTPAPAERDPRRVFERLFGGADPVRDAERRARRKSVLDFVMDDAKRMHQRLDGTDQAKMDEYLTAVRDVEQRIENAEQFRTDVSEELRPNGVPETYGEHIRAMYDLMALAFRTDTTRISTFLLAHDGSNRAFPEIGVPEAHHHLSHHQQRESNLEKIAQIDRFYIEQFAYFLQTLQNTREEDGSSLLDNTLIVYGSGIADGNRHNHDDLPVLLAGHGGGSVRQGRLIQAAQGTPMTNLYLSLLDRMGSPLNRFGDSTERFDLA